MYVVDHPPSAQIQLAESTWVLGDRLGGGGFGAVHYGAADDGTTVVLKFVPESGVSGREALLAQFPESRHVLPVLDSGVFKSDLVLVLPLAEYSLREHLDSDRFPADFDSQVQILQDIASGLVEIEGVVHRDLKPENILFHDGTWKLTDFGASRLADASTATATQKFVGTWPYFSPEQWRFDHATPACDVYAFGGVATEVLSGHRPFAGPNVEDFKSQHLSGVPNLEGVPLQVKSLVGDCLQKPPEARPTAEKVLERLTRVRSVPESAMTSPLAQANALASSAKLADQIEQEKREAERARRQELFDACEHQWNEILQSILDEIRALGDQASIDHTDTVEKKGNPVCIGFEVKLNGAVLELPAPGFVSVSADLPMDVIGATSLRVTNGHQGRSHSLWYCNHGASGKYQWWELSFMTSPLDEHQRSLEPFALDPASSDAREAFGGGVGTLQLARPITAVDVDDLSTFTTRWVNLFGAAAMNQLERPRELPEKS